MRFIRKLLFALAVLGALGAVAGFAYFTHVPESPILARAETWPAVGPLAARFRRAYLGSTPDDRTEGGGETAGADTEVEVVFVDRDGNEIVGPINLSGRSVHPDLAQPDTGSGSAGSPASASTRSRSRPGSAPGPAPPPPPAARRTGRSAAPGDAKTAHALIPDAETAGVGTAETAVGSRARRPAAAMRPRTDPPSWQAQDWRWFLPENPVRRSPGPDAEAVRRLRGLSYLPVLAEQGSWAEVVVAGERGFVDRDWQPPYRRSKARRGLLRHQAEPVRVSDQAKLRAARKHFGTKKPTRALGPYQLFTDVEDEELLDLLDQVAGLAEDAYFARFGRLPSDDPLRTAVLFAREADYQAFSASDNVPLANRAGHAGIGVLLFYAEGRSNEELASILMHEIGHLLNDRALAYFLPPWLEEGLAEELAALWFEREPRPAVGSVIRLRTYAARLLMLEPIVRQGRLPSVEALLRLDTERFYTQGIGSVSYAMSAAFVRYLLDGEGGRHAEGFRDFLARIAGGIGADLQKQLGTDFADLDRGLRAFITAEAASIRARYPTVRFRR